MKECRNLEKEGGGGDGQAKREREGGQQFLEITQGAFSRLVNPLWKSGLSSLLGCSKGEKAALPSLYNRPVSLLRKVNMNAFANKFTSGREVEEDGQSRSE